MSYWLDRYEEVDSLKFLQVFIQGEGLCAKTKLTIKEIDDKLSDIIKAKGKGYSGAELKNLQIEVYQVATTTELIYRGMDKVVD